MKSLSHFDSSYSPNEANEANTMHFDCWACSDSGLIDADEVCAVYCDCRQGKARAIHEYEDSIQDRTPINCNDQMQDLLNEYRAYGDC
tara:strand:+ start:252 stop:515 length:264 start_codon:yes stop_codon:yes gene_type:complete